MNYCSASLAGCLFDDEVLLDAGFDAARAALENLTARGSLTSASKVAYGEGIAELIRVGPLGSVPGMSKLVEVRFRDLVERDDSAGLAVRWEAIGLAAGFSQPWMPTSS